MQEPTKPTIGAVQAEPPPSNPGASSDFNADSARERAILRKITWRLLPLLFLCYIIAYIDRINVGFAKLQLREALGVDEAVWGGIYGTGAGLFFLGYFLFEVPSNLVLQRVGARIWIARIMVIWGIVSTLMMFMKSVPMFYTMRFLLGIAEAGFFPGVILYLTYWFPAKERARTVAMFAAGGVIAGIVGSPLSGAILSLDGAAGLAGWRWLFLLEGIPAVLFGVVILAFSAEPPATSPMAVGCREELAARSAWTMKPPRPGPNSDIGWPMLSPAGGSGSCACFISC